MKEHSLHAGHRRRMLEKFLAGGKDSMPDHEILELLLYYAIPRKDTNETAHRLFEECGSLEKVLDADSDRLCSVPGVGANTAAFLALVRETAKRYLLVKTDVSVASPVFDDPRKIATFLWPKYIGLTTERIYLLLFDSAMHILDCQCMGDGAVSFVLCSVRKIAQLAYRKNAACVVLAHNHPEGIAVPSANDVDLTRQISKTLSTLEIPLLEHFIFANNQYCTISSYLSQNPQEEVETPCTKAASPIAFHRR